MQVIHLRAFLPVAALAIFAACGRDAFVEENRHGQQSGSGRSERFAQPFGDIAAVGIRAPRQPILMEGPFSLRCGS